MTSVYRTVEKTVTQKFLLHSICDWCGDKILPLEGYDRVFLG